MYKYSEINSANISLHDCRANKMKFENGILSFEFKDGFWVTPNHPQNESKKVICTASSQVDFEIIDKEIEGIEIYIFKTNKIGKVIREEWKVEKFINAVNTGSFQVEFIAEYKSYQSFLFKCWVWLKVKPYHYECEIILHSEKVTYLWNHFSNL